MLGGVGAAAENAGRAAFPEGLPPTIFLFSPNVPYCFPHRPLEMLFGKCFPVQMQALSIIASKLKSQAPSIIYFRTKCWVFSES